MLKPRRVSLDRVTDNPQADDSSPASYEKLLSTLASKINKGNANLDALRQNSRRFKLFLILYLGFAWLVCATILVLVVGWRNWGLLEYVALVGGPLM